MRNIILITVFFLSFCTVLTTYQRESPDEQLAYKMSRYESFKAIINSGKRIAIYVQHLPNSVKNNMRQFKNSMDLIRKNVNLNVIQKRDPILQLVKFVSKTDTAWLRETNEMIPVYKKFNKEFPEFKRMSKQEKLSVFKNAEQILIKNSKHS